MNVTVSLARIPAKWNCFADKDLRLIDMLEQILIAKACPGPDPGSNNFGGICSGWRVTGRKTGIHFS